MGARSGSHPTDATLQALAEGRLTDAAARQLTEHLDVCPECRARAGSLTDNRAGGQGNDSRPPSAPAALKAAPPAGVPRELADLAGYEVVRELGRGGMGVVYLARNKMMDRLEVLKMVSKAQVGRPEAIERFLQEIRSAARLIHPNVATAFSVHALGDLLVLAMEYVDGDDLAKVVRLRGALPVANACYCIYQAAMGLQRGHEAGMVHRDIKPGNLLLTRQGKRDVVKIVDFGLAKAKTEVPEDRDLTGTNQMMGTPGYTAPEQLLDAKSADIRADVYSLGCTLYCLLTGSRAFQGNSVYQVLLEQEKGQVIPLREYRSDLPDGLQEVVSRMMAKEPADRFQTPADVARALAPFFKMGLRESLLPAGGSPDARPAAETIGSLQSADTLPPKEPGPHPRQPLPGPIPVTGQSPAGSSAAAESSVVVCPQCAAVLSVRAGLLGKRVKCKKCTTVFVANAGAPPAGEVVTPSEPISRAESVPPGPRTAPRITDLPTVLPGAGGPRPGTQVARPAAQEDDPIFEAEPESGPPGGISAWNWVALAGAAVVVFTLVGAVTALLVNPSLLDGFRAAGQSATASAAPKPQKDNTESEKASKKGGRPDPEKNPNAPQPVADNRKQKAAPPARPNEAEKPPAPAPRPPAAPTPAQLAALRGTDLGACRNAFEEVAAMGNSEARIAVPALLEAAGRSDPGLRTAIIGKLQQIGPPHDKDFECLQKAILLNCAPAKMYAIQQLEVMGNFDPATRAEALVEGLRESNAQEVRLAAEAALAKLGAPAKGAALKPLLRAADDRDDDVSRKALDALVAFRPFNSAIDLDALVQACNDRTARVEVRCFAAKQLGELGKAADRAAPDLRRVLQEEPDAKTAALKSETLTTLSLIGNKDLRTMRALVELANSDREQRVVRLAALDTVIKLDASAVSVDDLLRLMPQQGSEQNKEVSEMAAALLDKRIEALHANQLTELLPLLKHKDPGLVMKALVAVGNRKQAAGIASEVARLASDSGETSVRAAALDALQASGPSLGTDAKAVGGQLLKSFRDKSIPPDEKLKMAFAIAAIQPTDSAVAKAIVPRLLEELQSHGAVHPDDKVREKVVRILEGYGQPAVNEVIKGIDSILDGSNPHHSERTNSRRELYSVLARMGKRLKSEENQKEVERLMLRERKGGNKDSPLRNEMYEALKGMQPN
jgi:serine/threonine protein kinase